MTTLQDLAQNYTKQPELFKAPLEKHRKTRSNTHI